MRPLLYSMIFTLIDKGEPIFFSAKGKSFQTGPYHGPYDTIRSHEKGWLITATRLFNTQDKLRDGIERNNSLTLSSQKEYALKGTGTIHSFSVRLEEPVDQHYTLKNRDGVWTIVDVEPKKDDIEEAVESSNRLDDPAFLLKLVHKKMLAAGLDSDLIVSNNNVTVQPHIMTTYAAFSIKTFFDRKDEGDRVLSNVWFLNGRRTGEITPVYNADGAVEDIIGKQKVNEEEEEAKELFPYSAETELFMLNLLHKRLVGEGYHSEVIVKPAFTKLPTQFVKVSIPPAEGEKPISFHIFFTNSTRARWSGVQFINGRKTYGTEYMDDLDDILRYIKDNL